MRVLAAGDTAIVVEFGDDIDRALSARVLGLAEQVHANAPAGVVEAVPTFRSLLVHYDPLITSGQDVAATIRNLATVCPTGIRRRRCWTIPACYAPEFAPDLADVTQRSGLSVEEVIACHTQTRFHVYMIGFSPGHPYMGNLPRELAIPRRSDPRLRVPRGAIGIATGLTVIYPADNPSGWHLIGATPVELFDPAWERPSLLTPGDSVRFAPITSIEFAEMRSAVEAGRFAPTSEEIVE